VSSSDAFRLTAIRPSQNLVEPRSRQAVIARRAQRPELRNSLLMSRIELAAGTPAHESNDRIRRPKDRRTAGAGRRRAALPAAPAGVGNCVKARRRTSAARSSRPNGRLLPCRRRCSRLRTRVFGRCSIIDSLMRARRCSRDARRSDLRRIRAATAAMSITPGACGKVRHEPRDQLLGGVDLFRAPWTNAPLGQAPARVERSIDALSMRYTKCIVRRAGLDLRSLAQ